MIKGGAIRFQAPSGRNTLDLTRSVLPVAACADHRRVGSSIDLLEDLVIRTIEEVLHQAGNGGKIFRGGEYITVGRQQIARPRFRCMQQSCRHRGLGGGACCSQLAPSEAFRRSLSDKR